LQEPPDLLHTEDGGEVVTEKFTGPITCKEG